MSSRFWVSSICVASHEFICSPSCVLQLCVFISSTVLVQLKMVTVNDQDAALAWQLRSLAIECMRLLPSYRPSAAGLHSTLVALVSRCMLQFALHSVAIRCC